MTGASPWSVKGISAEERELAKQAARRAGVPIGQWLSRQIREAAEAERSGRAAAAQPAGEGRFGHPPGAWRGGADTATMSPGPTAAAWRASLAPDLPHPPPVQYAPVQPAPPQAVAPPQQAVAHPPAPRPQPPAVDPARVRELERRVRDLAELEGRVTALEKLERRLGAIASDLGGLTARLDGLEEAEKRSEARSSALGREVKALAARVDELQSQPSGGGDAIGSIAASTAPIERAVMRLAERLQRVEELTLPEERSGRGLLSRLFRR